MRAFNIASGPFLKAPPAGFAEVPLVTPRGELTICDGENRPALDKLLALDGMGGNEVREISLDEAAALVPDEPTRARRTGVAAAPGAGAACSTVACLTLPVNSAARPLTVCFTPVLHSGSWSRGFPDAR